MKEVSRKFVDILIRYFILVITAFPNLQLFYFIFTPLTIYPVYFMLSFFMDTSLMGNIINIGKLQIELIPACIAGSAYYLLLILNLSTRNIKIKKRIKMILFSFSILIVLNIIRIFVLSLIYVSGNSFFDLAHVLFWYIGSTIFVVGIWFTEVKIFKIKEIPVYSDIKFLYQKSVLRKQIKKS